MKICPVCKKRDESIYDDLVSNCCDAKVYANTDICSKCKEHCEPLPSAESELTLDSMELNKLLK